MSGTDTSHRVVRTVWHYKRRSKGSETRELIAEHVVEGSDTHQFILRAERQRRAQECHRTIDMRGHTERDCNAYLHRNTKMWMDDDTYRLFVASLRQHGGLFTVGAYEDIYLSRVEQRQRERVAQAQLRQQIQRAAQRPSLKGAGQPTTNSPAAIPVIDAGDPLEPWRLYDVDPPGIISMNYFCERLEERLEIAFTALLHWNDTTTQLTTRDLSPTGLKAVTMTPLLFDSGELVEIELHNVHFQGAPLRQPYRVLGLDHTQHGIELRMVSHEPDILKSRTIAEFITANSGKNRIDTSDQVLTATSLLSERLYAQSTTTIPLFFTGSEFAPRLRVVGLGEGNRELLDIFRDASGGYDLSPLIQGHRVNYFLQMGKFADRPAPLLMLYRDNESGSLISSVDFEFPTRADWVNYTISRRSQPQFRILKVTTSDYCKPSCRRLMACLDDLMEKDYDSAEEIVSFLDQVVAIGTLSDMTHLLKEWVSAPILGDAEPTPVEENVIPLEATPQQRPPEIVPLGRELIRREPRFLVKTDVELTFGNKRISTHTFDLSTTGTSVVVEGFDIEPRPQEVVSVTFTRYAAQTGKRFLNDIWYKVAAISDDPRRLHLARFFDSDGDQRVRRSRDDDTAVTEFFRNVLKRNADKLRQDFSDTIDTAHARMLEAVITASSVTLPLLIGKNEKGLYRLLQTVEPDSDNAIFNFFEIAPDEFDFSAIAEHKRIQQLINALRRESIASLPIYMFRRPLPGQPGRFEILSATESEFTDSHQCRSFFAHALEHEYRFIKIVATRSGELNPHFVDQVTERLQSLSPHRAHKVREMIGQVSVVADIVDVTRESAELYIDQLNRDI